jgi:hypothetical protein
MPDIFISYRREDSSGHAGRLFDCIRERFGDESVFMDVTDISPGDDFTVALDSALSACRVVLVVIGPHWLTNTGSDGRRRLDDPGDHLRMEVARALQRTARVIPVLVRGAAMPQERDLPEDLRALARRQAHEVSDSRWSFDTEQLVRIVERALGTSARAAGKTGSVAARSESVSPLARSIRIAGATTVFVVLIGLTAYFKWFGAAEPDEHVNPPGSTSSTNAAATAGRSRDATMASGRSNAEAPEARLPPSAEVRAGAAIFKVHGGLVSRRDNGPHTVRLFVRTTNVSARYGLTLTHDSFRLVVDEQSIAPAEGPIEVLVMQSSSEGWVTFRVPESASAVALQVGDLTGATSKIPIDLRRAGTVAAEKPPPTWRSPVDIAASFERRVGDMLFTVDGMRLEHYGDAVAPLQPEKLLLTIHVRLKNVGGKYGYAMTGEDFRLLVNDVPLAPTMYPIEAMAYEAELKSDVVFVIPGTAVKTELQLGQVAAEHVRVPLDLSAARRQP